MKLTTNTILIFFGILGLMILACFPIAFLALPIVSSNRSPSVDSQATIQAMVTQTMFALTQTAPTQTPLPPTPTIAPPTNTPVPTSTPVSYCDWAAFIADMSVPDGSTFAPGEAFTKVWRLRNRGTCTWTPDYDLVFYSGTQMNGTVVPLTGYTAPGQTIDVAVTLTSPSTPGHYVGYWMLRNATGGLFATGDRADKAFYLDIYVVDFQHGTVTGNICYVGGFNPPMTLYFEKVDTGETIQFAMPENHNNYSVLLSNGKYYAYTWAPGYSLEGAYTNPDLTMKILTVKGGQTTSNINICGWSPNGHGRGQ